MDRATPTAFARRPAVRTVLLLAALEPSAPRARFETALVLLGTRGSAVADAAELGLLRVLGDVVDLVDGRVRRVMLEQVPDRERRLAHLALAIAGDGGGSPEYRVLAGGGGRALFDELAAAIDPARPVTGLAQAEGMTCLTDREREVATIAATGLSNREIATRTAISPKTVEFYLTRIYRKLGVRCRAELAFAYGPRSLMGQPP
jgi:DNA-binding CsgD family transcriptional regulator